VNDGKFRTFERAGWLAADEFECPRCGGTGSIVLLGTEIEIECPDCCDPNPLAEDFPGQRITGEEFPHE